MDNDSRCTLFSKKLSVLIGIMFTCAHKWVCWLKSLPLFSHVFPLLFPFLSVMATVCEAKRGSLSVASSAVPIGSMWTSIPKCCLYKLSVHQRAGAWAAVCSTQTTALSFSLPHGAVSCKPKGAACLLESFSNYSMSSSYFNICPDSHISNKNGFVLGFFYL